MTIEKLKDKLHDKIEIHVCEVEENTLIAQGMLKALGMMDEVLETAEQEQTDKSNLEKICEELAAENDDLRDQLDMRDRFKQEPKWIPISERLPEDGKTVIASIKYGVYPETRYTKEYGWEWAYEAGADYWRELKNVEAWMPLPKPYEPQESEDKE